MMYIIYSKTPDGRSRMLTHGIGVNDNTFLEDAINYILSGKVTPHDTKTEPVGTTNNEVPKEESNDAPKEELIPPEEMLSTLTQRLMSGEITAEQAEKIAEDYLKQLEEQEKDKYPHNFNGVQTNSPDPTVSNIVNEAIKESELEAAVNKLADEYNTVVKERDEIHKLYGEMKMYRDNLMRQRDDLSEKYEQSEKRAEYWEERFNNLVKSIENGLKLGL